MKQKMKNESVKHHNAGTAFGMHQEAQVSGRNSIKKASELGFSYTIYGGPVSFIENIR